MPRKSPEHFSRAFPGAAPGSALGLFVGSLLVLACGAGPPDRERVLESRWWKGNTHAHTLWDNGDALPEAVARWYKSHGYQFLALSDHNDHNALTEAEKWIEPPGAGCLELKTFSELRTAFDDPGRFLLLPGEELGDEFQGKLIHHNVLNLERIILPPGGGSVREVMRHDLQAAQAESVRSGRSLVVQLNHPNLGPAVGADDLADVSDERFFEVYSGHPVARIHGDRSCPSTDELWDRALASRLKSSRDGILYGVASDDAHNYSGAGPAHPGRGWIMVRAPELTPEALVRALLAGDFYASTGVLLEEVHADRQGLSVKVAASPGASIIIRFLGTRRGAREAGELLGEVKGSSGSYVFTGDELYVRAVVLSDRPQPDPAYPGDCERAWVQPVLGPGRFDR